MVLFGDKDDDRKINTETAIAADNSLPEEIVQRHFYYAYGMEMEGPWQHTPPVRDAYMYNGKELLGDLGMNLSDYGARWYDPTIGRWGQVDPLSEKTFSGSVYFYVLGNPIGLIDPTGMIAEGSPGFPSTSESSIASNGQSRPKPILYYVNNSNWTDARVKQAVTYAAEIFAKNGTGAFEFHQVSKEEAMKHAETYEYQAFLSFENLDSDIYRNPGLSNVKGNTIGVYKDGKFKSWINLNSRTIRNHKTAEKRTYAAGYSVAHEYFHQLMMYVGHYMFADGNRFFYHTHGDAHNLNSEGTDERAIPNGPSSTELLPGENILPTPLKYIKQFLNID